MDDLVDDLFRGGEPVVDGAEGDQYASDDAGLLGNLAHRCLVQGLVVLDVSLGQAPLDPTGPVATRDDRYPGDTFVNIHDNPASGDLLHRRQPAWQPGRTRGR